KDGARKDGPGKDGADPHGAPGATAHGAIQASFGPTYLIKDRIVNLADGAVRRYLRFSVAIEFASHETPKASAAPPSGDARSHLIGYTPGYDGYQQVSGGGKNDAEKQFQNHVKRYAPAMEDAVTTLLSSKTYAEVATAERREATKQEIKARLGSLLDGTDLTVTNVYFTDFVVQ
ncbi:MAG TPA: flagellar basal body-associated FliL family protein, partial [Chloroflexota bacterium]